MREVLLSHGFSSLFLMSFLAATLLPIGSEWLLVALLLVKKDPVVAVAVACAGNYLGALTTYWIGIYGGPFLTERVLGLNEEKRGKAHRFYERFGAYSLLFSWLPVVGDPLCLVGGVLRVKFLRFSLLVFAGKLGRYAAVAWLTLQGKALF
ncbi:DedA family protein [Geomonas sp. RF6]|uniref:YqaA family protein n=1 Tax=Geomonas sp. RF6 TaxID=2897342 RepID=UPI001E544C84|nr:YqaA family protein [Geomonas sp. RF6]UFS72784.1 DedA family protein [Geomonas sp. RF6]